MNKIFMVFVALSIVDCSYTSKGDDPILYIYIDSHEIYRLAQNI